MNPLSESAHGAESRHPGYTRFVDCAPGRVVANQDLPIPFANIAERTGILTRNFAHPEDTVETLAETAARKLFDALGIDGNDCTAFVLASSRFDTATVRELAELVARRLGIAGEVDAVNFACSGFPAATVKALDMCRRLGGHVLIVTVELLSRMVDFRDENTAILFGDRAAATTVHPAGRFEILDAHAEVLPDDKHMITVETICDALDEQGNVVRRQSLRMRGKDLYRMAPGKMLALAMEKDSVRRHGEPSVIVYHQANGKFGEKMRKLLARDGFSEITVVDYIQHMGNVAGCSIPATLAKLQDELPAGKVVACPTVGAGPDLQPGTLTQGIVVFRVA